MKKILAYLMVGIAFTGCNSLDLEPISSIADNKYWQTEAQVDAFNVGLHSKFREKCSYSIFLFGEPRADYYFGESTFGSATQGNERMWNNSLNDVNTVVSNFGNLYEVINQANLMINKVEGMSMNESTKKYYLGEVYGIRAFLYFQLLRSYGDVVIWTDFSEGSSLDLGNLARPASSAADEMFLFVVVIYAKTKNIDNVQYFECLVGLVNAVLEMNQSFLKEKQIKIMLLIRPDIMYKMPVHNMNQKLRNNSVLLNWVTSYRKYIDSKLFKIADDNYMKQQDYSYELGEC